MTSSSNIFWLRTSLASSTKALTVRNIRFRAVAQCPIMAHLAVREREKMTDCVEKLGKMALVKSGAKHFSGEHRQ